MGCTQAKVTQEVHKRSCGCKELQAIDAVKGEFTYKGWRQDLKQVEADYVKYPSLTFSQLEKMRRKQAVYDRDRSSKELQAIDAVKGEFTYKGWKQELKQVEADYVEYPSLTFSQLEKMRRKQAVHDRDRSSKELQAIDAVKGEFTYKGWRQDLKQVEADYVEYASLTFSQLEKMRRKQAVHDRDRSSKELQAIDAVKGEFTYKGWMQDLKQVEADYVEYASLTFSQLEKMRRKQAVHDSDRSSKELQAIDAVKGEFTYKGWKQDLKQVEADYVEYASLTFSQLEKMRRKQAVHDRNRSSKELQPIDAVADQFTYKGRALGRQQDLQEPLLIESEREEMLRKQAVHDGDRRSKELQAIDDVKNKFTYNGWRQDLKKLEAAYVKYPSLFVRELETMRRKQVVQDGNSSSKELQAIDALIAELKASEASHVYVGCVGPARFPGYHSSIAMATAGIVCMM